MNDEKSELLVYRPFRDSDMPFVMDSWLKTLRVNNDFFRQIDINVYKQVYPQIIQELVHNCITTMAALKEDDDVLIGYACYTPTTLHWTFVKNQWRGLGIMKDLVPKHITFVSHLTRLFKPIMNKYNWRLNPFL
jgi:hypothetical protein